MVLPSREIIKDLRKLINEVTGFREDEENFYICEQYCLSHIMHHTYPSVNRFEVKKLIDGYVHRFFIHGYFKVAERLEAEVKSFLSNGSLFEKNLEFDIQWVMLCLVTSLATNLTAVTKVPTNVPIEEDERPPEEFNWGEYLKEGLPRYENSSPTDTSNSDLSISSNCSITDEEEERDIQNVQELCNTEELGREVTQEVDLRITPVASNNNQLLHRQHIIDKLVERRENEISYKRDIILKGNFVKELSSLIHDRLPSNKPQILSEFELVGYVLNQFLTGENIIKRKGFINPSTCSLTEVAVKNYLLRIEPYIQMINSFREFRKEVLFIENGSHSQFVNNRSSDANLSHSEISKLTHKQINTPCNGEIHTNLKNSVPNVVKLYNVALAEALIAFENKILVMSEFQNSYTLLQVLYELRPSLNDLSTLYSVHLSATSNWLNEPNWLCSVRIIATLYKAVLQSTSNRMGFTFMNMLLFCLQSYLDITDSWISCLTLNDPHEEYIIYRSNNKENIENNSYTYEVHPYAEELKRIGIEEITVLDHLADKMIHVGHSIDVLQRLDRSLIKEPREGKLLQESLYKQLLKIIKRELRNLEESISKPQIESKELTVFDEETKSITEKSEDGDWQNNLTDTSHSSDMSSFKTAEDSSFKDTTKDSYERLSVDSEFDIRDIALDDFCKKLCENDKTESIEKSMWPLGIKIDRSVKSVINMRVLNTCDIAKDIVVNEFQLKFHLRLLRNVFLFNEPHLILPFMNVLFHKGSMRQNCYVLSSLLRKCLESRYENLAAYLSVTVENGLEKSPENILQAIDRITINYQVHWPLQLIFTPHIMKLYNNIFRHLFKFHWAHDTLCKLRFTGMDRDTPDIMKSSCRRLELLRFWCLSSLGRLRSYFMAQISTPFDLNLDSYQHLKHIIKAHEDFVEKIHSRCLLNDDNSEINDLIFKVLIPLCCDVYQFWSTGHLIPDSKLTFIENVFLESQKRFPRLMAALEEE